MSIQQIANCIYYADMREALLQSGTKHIRKHIYLTSLIIIGLGIGLNLKRGH